MDQQPTTTIITLGTSALKAAVSRYHKALKNFECQEVAYEMGLRGAFQTLLTEVGHMVKWTLVPEQTLEGGIRPDGVLRDEFKFRRGYWEAKGPKGNLDKEIEDKKKKNYPLINTIFENTKRAVLYQYDQAGNSRHAEPTVAGEDAGGDRHRRSAPAGEKAEKEE